MKSARGLLATLALLACVGGVAFAPACGGDDITFGGDEDDDDNPTKVTFTGNIDTVSPVTARDIVVFVYSLDDDDDNGDRCPCPEDPSCLGADGKAAIISNDETEFTLSDLEPGAFGVVFLLDNAGDQADGQIDDGDPIAVLDDRDCQIDDVEGRITVTLEDIDIEFADRASCASPPDTDCTDDPPAPGRARADLIRLQTTVPDTDTDTDD